MPATDSGHFELTAAEREFLPLLARGLHNAEIVAALGLADDALKKRLQRFYDKTSLDRFSAIGWAKDHAGCCIAEA